MRHRDQCTACNKLHNEGLVCFCFASCSFLPCIIFHSWGRQAAREAGVGHRGSLGVPCSQLAHLAAALYFITQLFYNMMQDSCIWHPHLCHMNLAGTKSTHICLQYELYSTICAFTFIILLALQFHIPFCLFMYCGCNYSIHNLFLCNAILMHINFYLLPPSDSVRLWPCLWRSGAREHSSRTQTEAQKHMWVEEPWSLLDTVVITVFTSSSSLSSAVLLSFTMQHSMCNICVMQWILSQLLSYHAFTCFNWQHNINLHFSSNLLHQDSCFVENPVVALKGVLVKELHLVLLVDVCIACWS